MAQILVRNLDQRLVERLKKQARMNGRSLQAEVKMILEQSGTVDMQTARTLLARFRRGLKGRTFSDSADLIREDRDR